MAKVYIQKYMKNSILQQRRSNLYSLHHFSLLFFFPDKLSQYLFTNYCLKHIYCYRAVHQSYFKQSRIYYDLNKIAYFNEPKQLHLTHNFPKPLSIFCQTREQIELWAQTFLVNFHLLEAVVNSRFIMIEVRY